MSQVIFDQIDAAVDNGTQLAQKLNDFKDAVASGFTGTTRPPNLQAGGYWIDTTLAGSPDFTWIFKIYLGLDVSSEVFRINISSGISGVSGAADFFTVSKISADASAAILALSKARVASLGQVLEDDYIGELQFKAKDDDGTNSVTARIYARAMEDHTDVAKGTEIVIEAIDPTTSALAEKIVINNKIQTLVALKHSALEHDSQDVATTATILNLSATKSLVNFTGSTATFVQGINSESLTKILVIHNGSSANVTLSHQNGTASAINRMKLPGGSNLVIEPDYTATMFYSTTESRWKLQAISKEGSGGGGSDFNDANYTILSDNTTIPDNLGTYEIIGLDTTVAAKILTLPDPTLTGSNKRILIIGVNNGAETWTVTSAGTIDGGDLTIGQRGIYEVVSDGASWYAGGIGEPDAGGGGPVTPEIRPFSFYGTPDGVIADDADVVWVDINIPSYNLYLPANPTENQILKIVGVGGAPAGEVTLLPNSGQAIDGVLPTIKYQRGVTLQYAGTAWYTILQSDQVQTDYIRQVITFSELAALGPGAGPTYAALYNVGGNFIVESAILNLSQSFSGPAPSATATLSSSNPSFNTGPLDLYAAPDRISVNLNYDLVADPGFALTIDVPPGENFDEFTAGELQIILKMKLRDSIPAQTYFTVT